MAIDDVIGDELIPVAIFPPACSYKTILCLSGKNEGEIREVGTVLDGMVIINQPFYYQITNTDTFALSEADHRLLKISMRVVLQNAPYNEFIPILGIDREQLTVLLPENAGKVVFVKSGNKVVHGWHEKDKKLYLPKNDDEIDINCLEVYDLKVWHYSQNEILPEDFSRVASHYSWKITEIYWKHYMLLHGKTPEVEAIRMNAARSAFLSSRPLITPFDLARGL